MANLLLLDRLHLVIGYNNTEAAGACAICGGHADPRVGPALFLRETWEPVCDRCGERYAPELWAMLKAWWLTEEYADMWDGPDAPVDDPAWLPVTSAA